jgi:signal peptidase I
MSKSKPTRGDKNRPAEKGASDKEEKPADGGWRETVESIAMAVILALLFRGFVAEAFVIPTGSMAPTLRGRHKDIQCPECGIWYQVGASQEVEASDEGGNEGLRYREVVAGVCPSCRFTRPINRFERPDDDSFSGDRIIVSKFRYDFSPPERWDVIVFKFPGNATLNYIKRLIGLPNETVRIQGGNIWVRQGEEGDFQIARKPPDKLGALLQLVSDSDHLSRRKLDAEWPLEWIEGTPLAAPATPRWKHERTGAHSVAFQTDGQSAGDAWLRYRHVLATPQEWESLLAEPPARPREIEGLQGELISDFCGYNSFYIPALQALNVGGILPKEDEGGGPLHYRPVPVEPLSPRGDYWVDDLAVELLAEVQGDTGELLVDLVRAGIHYTCRINVASGEALLTRVDLDRTKLPFDVGGQSDKPLSAQTPIRGQGTYRIRMSNCDHEVILWVNGRVMKFDRPARYASDAVVVPRSTPEDYGDLLPAGVGTRQVAARLSQLRVFRDVYYIAQFNDPHSLEWSPAPYSVEEFFRSPELWSRDAMVRGRESAEFKLGPDQFFPLGDNSPQSQDARTWPMGNVKMPTPNYVERDLLIGKAMFVYWPHTWNRPVPYTPNPMQMRPIR